MTERISLRRLDYFVVAAEAGTMTGAAQRLYVSQSAVSLGIAELERQLGVQLLLRSKAKGLTLTEAGRQLLPQARALLARTEELEADIRDIGQAPAGRLMVGCFTTLGPFLLPRLLEEFQAAHPEVVLDFMEGSLVELQRLLLEGRCELAVMYGVDIEPGVDVEVLYETRPHIVLPPGHRLAGEDAVKLADLAGDDMIMLDVPPSMQYFSRVLASAGVTPTIRHQTRSFELARSLVARGVGYSLLIQRPAVQLSYEGRPLRPHPIADDVPPLTLVLARPAGVQLTRRAAAFAEFCRATVADYPELTLANRSASRYLPEPAPGPRGPARRV
jgi:DNA-binding transcriptional LysR family regulator